jgi:hypothetical protein
MADPRIIIELQEPQAGSPASSPFAQAGQVSQGMPGGGPGVGLYEEIAGQGAAAAGLGGLGAEAAIPVYGAVLMATQELGQSLARLGEEARSLSTDMAQFIQNDYFSVFTRMMDQAASSLSTISPIAGGLVKMFSNLMQASNTLIDSFLARSRQLAPFSPEISMAQAQTEVATVLADIREAQRLGPAMARMINAETELQLEVREMILPLKELVAEAMPALIEVMRGVVTAMEGSRQVAVSSGNVLDQIAQAVIPGTPSIIGLIQQVRGRLDEAARERQLDQNLAPFSQRWINTLLQGVIDVERAGQGAARPGQGPDGQPGPPVPLPGIFAPAGR